MRIKKLIISLYENYIKAFSGLYLIAAIYTAMHLYTIITMDYTALHTNKIIMTIRASCLLLSVYSFYVLVFALLRKRSFAVIFGIIATLFMFSNVVYFRAFESYINITQIFLIKQIFSVRHEASASMLPADLFLLGGFISSILVLYKYSALNLRVTRRHLLVCILIFFTMWEMRFLSHTTKVVYGYVIQQKNTVPIFNILTARRGKHVASLHYGMLYIHSFDLYLFSSMASDKDELDGLSEYKAQNPPIEFEEKPPNIFIIQVESIEVDMINRKTKDGVEITPYLNKLSKQSHYFDNMVAIHLYAGGTSDADFAVLTGTHPLTISPSFYVRGVENIPSLPAILKYHGYETAAFHANKGAYWGRSESYPNIGFDKYYSSKYFHGETSPFHYLIPDGPFFDQSFEFIKKMKEPFFAYTITMSSHAPYDPIENAHVIPRDMNHEITADTRYIQNFLRVINYTDRSVENYVKLITSTYDNYVIVIVGDHAPFMHKYKPAPEMVPMFILSSKLPYKAVPYNQISTHLDIPPTILSLASIPPPDRWNGENLFGSDRESICLLKPLMRVYKNGETSYDDTCLTDEATIAERYLRY